MSEALGAAATDAHPACPESIAVAVAHDPTRLELVVQPIVGVRPAEIVGYEALARFPTLGDVRPDLVFDAADRRGLGAALSVAVMQRAVELRDRLPPRTFLTVNCSPGALVDPAMQCWLSTADLGRMFVELTETMWPSDEHALLAAVEAVRAAGGRIAADDVGAGYSGLLHLVRLRPEMIKVDRQLVRMVGHDPGSSVVIRMLGDVAGQLDAWVLAEGVEDAVQLGVIVEMGVPMLQGFYLAPPAAPWPPADNLDRVWELALGTALPEHLLAHQREPAPGELITDDHGRPELIRIGRPAEPAILVRPLTMAPSTPVCEAIGRALARPDPVARVAPIVVTDEAGRPMGCVDLLPLVRQAISEPGR